MSSEVQATKWTNSGRAHRPRPPSSVRARSTRRPLVVIDAQLDCFTDAAASAGGVAASCCNSCNTGFDNPLRAGNPTARDRCRSQAGLTRFDVLFRPASLKPARRSFSLGALAPVDGESAVSGVRSCRRGS